MVYDHPLLMTGQTCTYNRETALSVSLCYHPAHRQTGSAYESVALTTSNNTFPLLLTQCTSAALATSLTAFWCYHSDTEPVYASPMHGRTHTPVSIPGHTAVTVHTPMLDAWMLHNTIQQLHHLELTHHGPHQICVSLWASLLLHPDNHPFRWHSTSLECTHTNPYSVGVFKNKLSEQGVKPDPSPLHEPFQDPYLDYLMHISIQNP